jgi:hypothetical protein
MLSKAACSISAAICVAPFTVIAGTAAHAVALQIPVAVARLPTLLPSMLPWRPAAAASIFRPAAQTVTSLRHNRAADTACLRLQRHAAKVQRLEAEAADAVRLLLQRTAQQSRKLCVCPPQQAAVTPSLLEPMSRLQQQARHGNATTAAPCSRQKIVGRPSLSKQNVIYLRSVPPDPNVVAAAASLPRRIC